MKLPYVAVAISLLLSCERGGRATSASTPVGVRATSDSAAGTRAAQPEAAISPGPDHDARPSATAELVAPREGMVLIPSGKFDMGMPPELTGGNPRVPTEVAGFFLDRLEVTTEAYLVCVRTERCEPAAKKKGCNGSGKKPRLTHPINCVTKVQAERYCAQQGKRLPSEAEWEYAARGTDGRTYPWGNELPNDQLCWQNHAGGDADTCPVGAYPQGASPFGALDMAGNVWEWTSTQETTGPVPPPAGEGDYRIRGGSFRVDDMSGPDDYEVRADQRSVYRYDGASTEIGFRCAEDVVNGR
jgi:formylglycine-generating enzyme required for sulfatase activity